MQNYKIVFKAIPMTSFICKEGYRHFELNRDTKPSQVFTCVVPIKLKKELMQKVDSATRASGSNLYWDFDCSRTKDKPTQSVEDIINCISVLDKPA